MRFAYYTGASVALAGAVVLRAFHERPNFYSAAVYLAQSNACLMVLINLALLCTFSIMFGLQRLLFGPLRVIEVEQLYDKAWIAVTETCLAMTMFREHIGAWFLVMFVALLAGKVWEWIGEGRVEFLEQQPPANPRLFHARLSTSLLLSIFFDVMMLHYCVVTVIYEARPGMMVMFAFEFALLMLLSLSTSVRYLLSLAEGYIVKKQTQERITARRAELNAAKEQAEREGDPDRAAELEQDLVALGDEDIDVPGWENKGRWIFYLDLTTDFIKLVVYMVFFVILLVFHGLPIHIIRDVFYTIRSFVKRINDFVRYRDATRDMNARYPDATVEELERESTCIICREEMRPWDPPATNDGQTAAAQDERYRPKKLPCGHILHFACLRSWLERQQVCPTCRRSVLTPANTTSTATEGQPGPQNQQAVAGRPRQMPPNQAQPAPAQPNNPPANQQPNRLRVLNLGPFRIAFGAGPENQLQNMLNQMRNANMNDPQAAGNANGANPPTQPPNNTPNMNNTTNLNPAQPLQGFADALAGRSGPRGPAIQQQLDEMQRLILSEMTTLQAAEWRLSQLQRLNAEVMSRPIPLVTDAMGEPGPSSSATLLNRPVPQAFSALPASRLPPMGPGDPMLPAGLVIPPGWTLTPLHRLSGSAADENALHPRMPATYDTLPLPVPPAGFEERRTVVSAGASRQASHEHLASSSTAPPPTTAVPATVDTTRLSPSTAAAPFPSVLGQQGPSRTVSGQFGLPNGHAIPPATVARSSSRTPSSSSSATIVAPTTSQPPSAPLPPVPAAVPAAESPNWGFGTAGRGEAEGPPRGRVARTEAEAGAKAKAEVGRDGGDAPVGESESTSGTTKDDKGKGRAVMVEDAEDDGR